MTRRNKVIPDRVNLFGETISEDNPTRSKFIEPPFTVLDTKTASWQKRKKQWANLGIKSEVGRSAKLFAATNSSFANEKFGRTEKDTMAEESIFDPALCELMYNWYLPDGGECLDPFAGGSVRGIVCNYLGYKYTGIDIREEQIVSNYEQSKVIIPSDKPQPIWHIGDSNLVLANNELIPNKSFDGMLSCPPYADLEVYSDLPGDISNMKYHDFLRFYRSIIFQSCQKLKDGAFAVWVIGEVRDPKTGAYYGFVPDTIRAFTDAGMEYYNEAVLLNMVGTAMLRANNIFEKGNKKLVKVHQNLLVFRKPEQSFSLEL